MSYDKPKVTIDLDEYNDLKQRVYEISGDELVITAKKTVFAVLKHQGDIFKASAALKADGINLSFIRDSSRDISYENILFHKIKTSDRKAEGDVPH